MSFVIAETLFRIQPTLDGYVTNIVDEKWKIEKKETSNIVNILIRDVCETTMNTCYARNMNRIFNIGMILSWFSCHRSSMFMLAFAVSNNISSLLLLLLLLPSCLFDWFNHFLKVVFLAKLFLQHRYIICIKSNITVFC